MRLVLCIAVAAVLAGCGHVHTTKVGLMSFGNLEGKTLPATGSATYTGKSCGHQQHLSDAVRNALSGTEYDTLINAEVTCETGLLVFNNCITVSGSALDSKLLTGKGGAQ